MTSLLLGNTHRGKSLSLPGRPKGNAEDKGEIWRTWDFAFSYLTDTDLKKKKKDTLLYSQSLTYFECSIATVPVGVEPLSLLGTSDPH